MIPLLEVAGFAIGALFGACAFLLVLVAIQRCMRKFDARKSVTQMSPPALVYNQEMSAEWLNELLSRFYAEATKSNSLFPAVSSFCKKVAKQEDTIQRLSLVDFSLGHAAPRIASSRILPSVSGDSVVICFEFSPELNINLDLVLQFIKGINIKVMAGCAVFLQSMKGGISVFIPQSSGECRLSFCDDVEIAVEVGARIGDLKFNTDEFYRTWDKMKKIIKSYIKKYQIKFCISFGTTATKGTKKAGMFKSRVVVASPSHLAFF